MGVSILLLDNDTQRRNLLLGMVGDHKNYRLFLPDIGYNAWAILRKERQEIGLMIINPLVPWLANSADYLGPTFLNHISTPCSAPKNGCEVVVVSKFDVKTKFRVIKPEDFEDFIREFFDGAK